jgi:hypothetical protein
MDARARKVPIDRWPCVASSEMTRPTSPHEAADHLDKQSAKKLKRGCPQDKLMLSAACRPCCSSGAKC